MHYLGRKVTRSDGIETRKLILDTTLDIIVEEGIRGVTHRTIANKANVHFRCPHLLL